MRLANGSPTDSYVQTGEFEDLCDLVRSAAVLAEALPVCQRHLRCILTELVNAFTVGMICALRRTDGGGVWKDKDETRLLQHNHERLPGRPSGMMIAAPRVLWERAKHEDWMANWGGRPIETNERRDELVRFALELRDEFHHFAPKGWSIDRNDMIEAAIELVQLVRELAEHASYDHRLMGEARNELSANLATIAGQLTVLKGQNGEPGQEPRSAG